MIQFPGSPQMPQFPTGSPFQPFQPGPSTVDTTYGNGGVNTVTQAPGAPMSNFDQLFALLQQKMNPMKKHTNAAPLAGVRTNRAGRQRVTSDAKRSNAPVNSWQQAQGAAMKPVGLGAQMIPGMQIDQQSLPPGMRHKESQFQGGPSGGAAGAGLSNYGVGQGNGQYASGSASSDGPTPEERWFQQFGSVPAWMR